MEQINKVRVDAGQKPLVAGEKEYIDLHGAIYYGVSLGLTKLMTDVTDALADIDDGVVRDS
jgi:hypothetical protein